MCKRQLFRCAVGLVCVSLACQALGEVATIRFGVVDPPVVAQRDVTVRLITSNHPQDPRPRPLECSGLAWAGGRLLMTSDRHRHVLFSVPIDTATATIGEPTHHVVVTNEKLALGDLEAITLLPRGERGGFSAVAICSMSNDPLGEPDPMRRHALSVRLDEAGLPVASTARVQTLSPIRQSLDEHFKALRVAEYAAYTTEKNRNTVRWANVEAMAVVPNRGDRLICGLRNPLAGGHAMLFVVEGAQRAFVHNERDALRVIDLFRLDLGGRGLSGMCWDPVTHGYLITAAKSNGPKLDDSQPYPPNNLDSALFWWSGHKADAPVRVATAPDLNLEAVCRVGEGPLIAIGSDEGDVSEGRAARQSVVTLMYFTQVPREGGAGDG